MNRESVIDKIVAAAARKPVNVVERRDYLYSDGKYYSPFGVPHGVKQSPGGEYRSYWAWADKGGITYGIRYKSEQEAIDADRDYIAKGNAEFRKVLEEMPEAKLAGQYLYWVAKSAATKVSRVQALALVGNIKKLLPKPMESVRQPGDASGKYWLANDGDNFITFTIEEA